MDHEGWQGGRLSVAGLLFTTWNFGASGVNRFHGNHVKTLSGVRRAAAGLTKLPWVAKPKNEPAVCDRLRHFQLSLNSIGTATRVTAAVHSPPRANP